MSNRYFLDDDDILVVNRTLAKAIGLNASIALRQVYYWMKENRKKKSEKHFHDQCWWTFNTYQEWVDGNFEFWSYDTVRRALKHLEHLGLIYVGSYNERKGDQTKWYTVNFGAYDAFMRLWTDHASPRAGDGRHTTEYQAFIEDWSEQKQQHTNMASCIDQYGKLHTPSLQVAQTVTRDYTEVKEKEIAPAIADDPPLRVVEKPVPEKVVKTRAKPGTIPAAIINPMKNAIAAAFGWDWKKVTRAEGGQIQAAAKQLCEAGRTPDDVAVIYHYCKAQSWGNFTPLVLASKASEALKSRTPMNHAPPPATSGESVYEAVEWTPNQFVRTPRKENTNADEPAA